MVPLPTDQKEKPKVLIVGAGIGGVCLALLLEKAGVPYLVFERASEIMFLGIEQDRKQLILSSTSFPALNHDR